MTRSAKSVRSGNRYDVFEFNDDDECVEEVSTRLVGKFSNRRKTKAKHRNSPISKYQFLQCCKNFYLFISVLYILFYISFRPFRLVGVVVPRNTTEMSVKICNWNFGFWRNFVMWTLGIGNFAKKKKINTKKTVS